VDAKKHSAFTGAKATGEVKVGGEFSAWDGYITGRNLELEKGKHIVQEWIDNYWNPLKEYFGKKKRAK
jgi:activator of HSP90 ATPase